MSQAPASIPRREPRSDSSGNSRDSDAIQVSTLSFHLSPAQLFSCSVCRTFPPGNYLAHAWRVREYRRLPLDDIEDIVQLSKFKIRERATMRITKLICAITVICVMAVSSVSNVLASWAIETDETAITQITVIAQMSLVILHYKSTALASRCCTEEDREGYRSVSSRRSIQLPGRLGRLLSVSCLGRLAHG